MRIITTALLCLATLSTPAAARETRREAGLQARPEATRPIRPQRGQASFYSPRFHGRRMANGERFDRHGATAASRTLPLGTRVRVRNLANGRTAVVTITDRGPHGRGRVLDVSPRTAAQLGMREAGVAMVEIVPVHVPRG
ncbi:septal ring lytic transglycosylase RlpA family protein [Roseomonas sp. OT10]|uniref:septal ring lytic transglycosylase RlpA family protein n=1 Tax=Roseomonas cutis TaxID=2897332 RepID=UPI001E48B5C4|nr:septal ring lytic transglycosylase RlpA family protein [Roseomonas sp. OT10]UFN48005.1 septal ring lytic transglycosylase RlpA family protein [Roseomonas sp. OT10]